MNYLKNRERSIVLAREYKKRNPDRIKAINDEYFSRPDVRIKSNAYCRNWHKSNREYVNKKNREYLSVPIRMIRHSLRCRLGRLIKTGKSSKTMAIIGCDLDLLRLHLEERFSPGMSWDNYGDWHVDHIIPLAKASTQEEVERLSHYTNLQPLWAKDNIVKGCKIL
jgi:hypothetical protein